jgi:hypothetical protein
MIHKYHVTIELRLEETEGPNENLTTIGEVANAVQNTIMAGLNEDSKLIIDAHEARTIAITEVPDKVGI